MAGEESAVSIGRLGVVKAQGEEPVFKTGDAVRISVRLPIGHFRVPTYIRGKRGWIESVIEPPAINNEEEGYGRNAGNKLHDYRVAISLKELWPQYRGSDNDSLRIEVL
jgi:nitrile hydratase subunit beta